MSPIQSPLSSRLLLAWSTFVRRHAWAVVIAALVASILSAFYVARNFAVNTNTADMISQDLPFQRANKAMVKAFPQDTNTLVVLVEGDNADRVDDAARALADRLRQAPQRFGTVFFPEGDPFFRRNGLLYLDAGDLQSLTDGLAEAQPFLGALAADPSLRRLFDLLALASDYAATTEGESAIALAPMFDAIAEQIDAERAGRPGALVWTRLMAGAVAEEGMIRRTIVLTPPLDFDSLRPAREAMQGVRDAVAALGLDAASGVRVRLTGEAALEDEELESAQLGKATPELISFTLVSIIAYFCFRSFRMAIAALLTVVAGLVWTAAFACFAVGAINLISVAFFILFIGFAVDFGIHYGLRYKEGIDLGLDHAGAMDRAHIGVGVALTLCALSAAIGFFSFLPTSYVGLAELGFIAGFGMAIALLANLTLMPALLTVLPGRVAVDPTEFRKERLRRWIEAHPKAILAVTAGLALAALVVAPQVRFDFDPLNLKSRRAESVQALRDLMADGSTGAYAISVLTRSVAEAQQLAARAQALPEVGATRMVSDFVPTDQESKISNVETLALMLEPSLAVSPGPPPTEAETMAAFGALRTALQGLAARGGTDGEAAGRLLAAFARMPNGGADPGVLRTLERRLLSGLPGRLAALRESLGAQPFTAADLPADLRDRWVSKDGFVRVEIFPKERVDGDNAALRRFVRAVQKIAPDGTGASVLIVEGGAEIVRAFIQAALTAIVAIAALLLLLLRNVRDTAFTFLPLCLAALFTIAASVLLHIPFNFANVVVLPLLFGLGVTASLNLVVRARQEGEAGEMLTSCTPRAVLYSALTVISAFGTLALSPHPGISSMGLLLAIAISLTLICTVIVLPALMVFLRHRRETAAAVGQDQRVPAE